MIECGPSPLGGKILGDKRQWCEYHRAKGNTTDACYALKNEIEALIRKGYLKKFTAKSMHDKAGGGEDRAGNNKRVGELLLVTGGDKNRGTNRRHKTHRRSLDHRIHYSAATEPRGMTYRISQYPQLTTNASSTPTTTLWS
ncbi:hypothetical protein vseg_013380 [Gypsophila vaccaria]